MLILFLKSIDANEPERKGSSGDEALEKIRIIFQRRVDEAETDEDRERAEQDLKKIQERSS